MALIGNPIVVGYNNAGQGQGYGTCGTAAATVAKVVSLANYNLQTGGVVSVKFTYAVPASATLNINSKGAKSIRYRGAAITANVIKAGDIATFMYDGTYYQLISVDRWGYEPNFSGAPTAPTAAVGTNTTQIATTEFVQNQIQNTNAGDVAYDSTATYSNGTVGDALNTINSNIEDLDAGDIAYSSSVAYSPNTVGNEVSDIKGSLNTKLLRFESVALSSGVSAGQIARVPSSGTNSALTEDSFVIEATFSNPSAILSNITVTKYAGYFTLTGTTGSSAGTVDIKMGNP